MTFHKNNEFKYPALAGCLEIEKIMEEEK